MARKRKLTFWLLNPDFNFPKIGPSALPNFIDRVTVRSYALQAQKKPGGVDGFIVYAQQFAL